MMIFEWYYFTCPQKIIQHLKESKGMQLSIICLSMVLIPLSNKYITLICQKCWCFSTEYNNDVTTEYSFLTFLAN